MTENDDTDAPTAPDLMEKIANRDNLNAAYIRVRKNKGSGGVDRMEMAELQPYLKEHATEIRQSLMDGSYRPYPVRGVEIPKDNGKKRRLNIPTLRDRVIQLAVLQQLTPRYEPQFVETSYGFRPGRSCHDALKKSQEYLNQGYVWTVDMDLEKFFDTVNQSKLIEILSRTIKEGRVISIK
jgi:group II intron reverse transcriptase/maturase